MLDNNALGGSGGARGVDDVGRVARVETDRRRGVGVLWEQRLFSFEQHQLRSAHAIEAVEQRTLGDEHGGAGVGQHEGEPLARVAGVERQIGAAGFEDAEQSDQHLRRALDAERYHHLRLDTKAAQMMRQPVRLSIERRHR